MSDEKKQQLNKELLPVLDNVQVYKDTFDLLVYVYRMSPEMNRDYRYTLGEEMKKALQQLLTAIYEAKKHLPPRSVLLEEAMHWCYEAKILYRIMDELNLLKSSKCAMYIHSLSSISKQLVAWHKYEVKKEKDNENELKDTPTGRT